MSPLLGSTYKNKIGTDDIYLYGPEDKVHGFELRDLVEKWYRTALSVPNDENPLMGDDVDGAKNKKFLIPLGDSNQLLICGGSWEKPSLQKGNENRVFLRKAVIDTKTVVFVSILNVILLPGGHNVKKANLVNTPDQRKIAFDQMSESMVIDKVSATFKISGPYPLGQNTRGVFLNENDLLPISTPLDKPFTDLAQNEKLETDPDAWHTVPVTDGIAAYTSGFYACFELKSPGTYFIDIDGRAPLAGHQEDEEHKGDELDQKTLDDSKFHLTEKFFHNSARYELEVTEDRSEGSVKAEGD